MPRAQVFRGFAARRGASLSIAITSSTNNVVLSSLFLPAQISGAGGIVRVTIASGVVIGSTNGAVAAFRTGSGWGTGWTAEILLASGSARIQGKGGAGGQGATRFAFVEGGCEPNGNRGGGGGGAGTTGGAGASSGGTSGTATTGGTGGANSQIAPCSPASNSASGGAGGPALEATAGGPNVELRPAVSATLEVWGGGGGGGGAEGSGTPQGGAGGGPGLPGSAGAGSPTPGAGGAAGAAYSTPGSATITEVGPGVIDKRG